MDTTKESFIAEVGAIAAVDMRGTGILASLTTAQAILESGWGLSGLAVRANALFGIKAGASWKGRVYSAETQECYDGANFTTITALFRAYGSWVESIADHSALLTGNARYRAVVGEKDYRTACKAIQEAGYATDPAYAEKLIAVIEQYGLTVYDEAEADKEGADTMNAQEKRFREIVVQAAQSYLGSKEGGAKHREIIDGYNAHKPLPRNYRVTYTDAWCATFVSFIAIKTGIEGLIPLECSCTRMIAMWQQMGRWMENDAYVPSPGDILYYDWQDTGSGDNKGQPDHVGIVEKVENGKIYVIEGNYNDSVKRRTLSVNGKYIRGYGLPDYASLCVGTAQDTGAAQAPASGSGAAVSVGDTVTFTGTRHYASADNAGSGSACQPGTAKVTAIREGQKHPYHLQAVTGGGSTVYGWVDAKDVQPVPVMRVGARVKYSGPVYRDSTGAGQGSSVSGTYTVKYYSPNRECGVHIGDIGWVPEKDCTVIG